MDELRKRIEDALKDKSHDEWMCKYEDGHIRCFFRGQVMLLVNSNFEMIGKGMPFIDAIIVSKIVEDYKKEQL